MDINLVSLYNCNRNESLISQSLSSVIKKTHEQNSNIITEMASVARIISTSINVQ